MVGCVLQCVWQARRISTRLGIAQICPLLRVQLHVRRRACHAHALVWQPKAQGANWRPLAIFCHLRNDGFRWVLPVGDGNPNVSGPQND